MNREQKIYIAAAAGIVLLSIKRYIAIHKIEKRFREEIAAKSAVDLEAVRVAEKIVIERMDAGRYSNYAEAIQDFEFEIIIHANKL